MLLRFHHVPKSKLPISHLSALQFFVLHPVLRHLQGDFWLVMRELKTRCEPPVISQYLLNVHTKCPPSKMVVNVRTPAVRVSPASLPSTFQGLKGVLTNSSCPVHSSDLVMRSMPICTR